MRLGVIEFGTPYAETAPLLAALRERGVDVITKLEEPPAQSPRDEAERLHRAECDGVLLTIGNGVVPDDVAEAMLFIHCPVVAIYAMDYDGQDRPEVEDAVNLIEAIAAASDFLYPGQSPGQLQTEGIIDWLAESSRTNRQKGIDVAHKLYGLRLYCEIDDDADAKSLKLRWLRQFGILLRDAQASYDARPDDIVATDGDALAALSERLLLSVSGAQTVRKLDKGRLKSKTAPERDDRYTVLFLSRWPRPSEDDDGSWGYYARVFKASISADLTPSACPMAYATLTAEKDTRTETIYAVAGDCLGALRAALTTLDVATVVLRDN